MLAYVAALIGEVVVSYPCWIVSAHLSGLRIHHLHKDRLPLPLRPTLQSLDKVDHLASRLLVRCPCRHTTPSLHNLQALQALFCELFLSAGDAKENAVFYGILAGTSEDLGFLRLEDATVPLVGGESSL